MIPLRWFVVLTAMYTRRLSRALWRAGYLRCWAYVQAWSGWQGVRIRAEERASKSPCIHYAK